MTKTFQVLATVAGFLLATTSCNQATKEAEQKEEAAVEKKTLLLSAFPFSTGKHSRIQLTVNPLICTYLKITVTPVLPLPILAAG